MDIKKKILNSNAKHRVKVEALLQEFAKIPEETLNRRPANGGWSAMQTAWHLLLAEELSYQYVQKKLGFGGSFDTVGLAAKWRYFLLMVALYLPISFKAPGATSGENLPEHSTVAELSERWVKSRADWTAFLSKMPDELANKAVYKHPRAGKIGWMQMLTFFSVHFARHLRQIRKAL